MEIRQALLADVDDVLELLALGNAHMRAAGIYQWDDVYPNRQLVADDAAAGALFVAFVDASCMAAAVSLDDIQPPEYNTLPGWSAGGMHLIVHRLCVHPALQRRGIARRMMGFAEAHARERGATSIRLDAYTGNTSALSLYERRGYHCVGQVYFARRELPFNCYELILDAETTN